MEPWHMMTNLPVQQPNKRAQGKTCGDCCYFSQCPAHGCEWGVCIVRTEEWSGSIDNFDQCWVRMDDGADFCEDYDED